MFVIGPKPFRAEVQLPNRTRISIKTVKEMTTNLPDLPEGGYFTSLGVVKGSMAAIFKYDNDSTYGCRTMSSKQHGMLPTLFLRHKDAAMFIQETKLCAGFKYLYGNNHPYSIKDKKINLEGYIPSSQKEKRIENTRTTDMQFELRAFLNDQWKYVQWVKTIANIAPSREGGI